MCSGDLHEAKYHKPRQSDSPRVCVQSFSCIGAAGVEHVRAQRNAWHSHLGASQVQGVRATDALELGFSHARMHQYFALVKAGRAPRCRASPKPGFETAARGLIRAQRLHRAGTLAPLACTPRHTQCCSQTGCVVGIQQARSRAQSSSGQSLRDPGRVQIPQGRETRSDTLVEHKAPPNARSAPQTVHWLHLQLSIKYLAQWLGTSPSVRSTP